MGEDIDNTKNYSSMARAIRRISLILAHNANSSHSGGALSMADILAVLYSEGGELNISPETVESPDRDRFVLSKGHCCASLYAALALRGFLPMDSLLSDYGKNGTSYFTHVSHKLNGVEISSGSLGHGLPVAVDIAIAGRARNLDYKTFVLTGDGELDEGSCWEAILFAGNQQLSNLCLIVDSNKIQSLGNVADINDLAPLKRKFEDFKWNAIEIDGHDYSQIEDAFRTFRNEDKRPTVIIADTVKGKGVSFMENNLKWHYSSPNDEQLKAALEELL